MNPPFPVSPSQSQAKIDQVLDRLQRLALESSAPIPHPPIPSHSQLHIHQHHLAQAHSQAKDTDSLSSHSSHTHSHTLSSTTGTTSSASSSPPSAAPQSSPYPSPQIPAFPPQPAHFHPQHAVNPNLANVASLYRLGVPSRLQMPAFDGRCSPLPGDMGMLTPGSASLPLGMGMGMGGNPGMGQNAPMPVGAPQMGGASGKAYSYRPGDWICVSPACSYPNFGRNEYCNACRSPRPSATGGGMPRAPPPAGLYFGPGEAPRFAAGRMNGLPLGTGGGVGTVYNPAVGLVPAGGVGMGNLGAPGIPGVTGVTGSAESGRSPMIVTPSGRAFASTGTRKNISGDDLNPVVIFWPDNEPMPELGQVRPCMLGLAQPPILNTGNKGPIEHQPGDWYCQKCEHLNWRRRKVCQNCYRFAEGNEDDTTLARQAECISVLIAQLVAAKKAQEAGVLLNLSGMMGVPAPLAPPAPVPVPAPAPALALGTASSSDGQLTPCPKTQETYFSPPSERRPQPALVQVPAPVPVPAQRRPLPATGVLYTPPALAAAQAYEPYSPLR